MAAVVISKEITNSGLSLTIDPSNWNGLDTIIYLYTTGSVTLAANIDITLSSFPIPGCIITIIQSSTNITRNGKTLNIVPPSGGVSYGDDWQFLTPSKYVLSQISDTVLFNEFVHWDLLLGAGGTGAGVDAEKALLDESLPLSKIADLSRGYIIVGNSSNRPTPVDANGNGQILIGDGTDLNSVAVTGDVTINSSGVTAIGSGVIVNADVNASAAISRSKLASGTGNYVVINDGAGAMSQEAQLANSRGGTGIDSSGSTGFPSISSGTWSVASLAVDRDLDVSFEAGEVGDFKIYMGFAGTLTNIYAYATKVIAGTDNGTIVPKNNSGTTMGTGTITFTASDARGTAYTATPSTNNTFVAGDILTFTTAKTTAGGKVHLSLKFTRNS